MTTTATRTTTEQRLTSAVTTVFERWREHDEVVDDATLPLDAEQSGGDDTGDRRKVMVMKEVLSQAEDSDRRAEDAEEEVEAEGEGVVMVKVNRPLDQLTNSDIKPR
jgi:hypothetical protein